MLRPNQSLSRTAFFVVMGVVAGVNLISGLAFFAIGAIPIIGFLGLDALIVWLAFRACFRNQRQWTRVRVTAEHLRVDHENSKGEFSAVELPSAFTRIELAEPLTANSWLTLAHRQEAYVIGRFLTIDERKSLSLALKDALKNARSERYIAIG